MKILVTGASGFIGSHLVENLAQQGHEVCAFVHYNSSSSWGWLDSMPLPRNVNVVMGDIRDYDSVKAATVGTTVVFHLAALVGIPYSYISPLAYVKTNVEGTYNVLQAARENTVQRIVHTSTSEVYGSAQIVPINESHPINPQSPYAATKASADMLAISFFRSFGIPVTVVRPFNTFGPRQSARAIIPTVVSQLLSGAENIELGNLTPTRDLTYVDDTVKGFIEVGLHPATVGKTINLGTGREISVGDLTEKIMKKCCIKAKITSDNKRLRPEKSEVERLISDPQKAYQITGWKAEVPLEEGIERYVEWAKKNTDKYRYSIYNV